MTPSPYYQQKEGYKEAAFNPALEKLRMLCRALELCNIGKFSYNADMWYRGCLALRTEIWSKLTPKEREKVEAELIKLTKLIDNYRTKKGVKMTPHLYRELDKFELHLRDLQEKHGLGIPDSDDPRFAVLKG